MIARAWFLKNNRALSKFFCGSLHYLISITKLSTKKKKKKSVHVSQFYINRLSHLNVWLVRAQSSELGYLYKMQICLIFNIQLKF